MTWDQLRALAKYRLQSRVVMRRYAVILPTFRPDRFALIPEAELRALWGDR